jgi:hypothetical protein
VQRAADGGAAISFPIRGSRRPARESLECWTESTDDCGAQSQSALSASSSCERFAVIPRCLSPPPPTLAEHDQRPQAAVRQTAPRVLSLPLRCLLFCGRPSQPSRTPAPHAVHCSITQRQLIIVPRGLPLTHSQLAAHAAARVHQPLAPLSLLSSHAHAMPMPRPVHAAPTLVACTALEPAPSWSSSVRPCGSRLCSLPQPAPRDARQLTIPVSG